MPVNAYSEGYLLRLPDVLRVVGLSRTTVWRKIHDGTFPAPLRLSERVIAWEPDDIAAWRKSRERRDYRRDP